MACEEHKALGFHSDPCCPYCPNRQLEFYVCGLQALEEPAFDEDDDLRKCEGCDGRFDKDDLNDNGQCDDCAEDERLEADHQRCESHSSRFL